MLREMTGMRILTLNLLAVALLLFGATSASAFAINMTAHAPTSSLTVNDTVTVDVFLDADGRIGLFSVSVVNDNPGALVYDGPASAALTIHHPVSPFGYSTGAQPSYILYALYTSGRGGGSRYLVPQQTPYFSTVPPDDITTEQVNINYLEHLGASTFTEPGATGTGIYIATMVFNVVSDFDMASLELVFTTSSIISQPGGISVDLTTVPLSAAIVVTPEPALVVLAVASLATLFLVGAHQRRVQRR